MKPNMVFFRCVCYIWILLLSSIAFTGQSANASRKFKVCVTVSCENQRVETLIRSYMNRELRSLGDVTLVTFKDARFLITLVALESHYKSGRKTGGVALACAYIVRSANDPVFYYYPDISVISNDVKEVDTTCKGIVATFDTEYLDRVRN